MTRYAPPRLSPAFSFTTENKEILGNVGKLQARVSNSGPPCTQGWIRYKPLCMLNSLVTPCKYIWDRFTRKGFEVSLSGAQVISFEGSDKNLWVVPSLFCLIPQESDVTYPDWAVANDSKSAVLIAISVIINIECIIGNCNKMEGVVSVLGRLRSEYSGKVVSYRVCYISLR